jgi:hypothetical protein
MHDAAAFATEDGLTVGKSAITEGAETLLRCHVTIQGRRVSIEARNSHQQLQRSPSGKGSLAYQFLRARSYQWLRPHPAE